MLALSTLPVTVNFLFFSVRRVQQRMAGGDREYWERWRDIEAGRRAGCRTVFVNHGYPADTRPPQCDFEASSLAAAADFILAGEARSAPSRAAGRRS